MFILLVFPKRHKDLNNTMMEKRDKTAVLQCFADQEDHRHPASFIVFPTECTICFLFTTSMHMPSVWKWSKNIHINAGVLIWMKIISETVLKHSSGWRSFFFKIPVWTSHQYLLKSPMVDG